ncbi:hypothetical protein E1180_19535 [Roseibium denhamense]|uniref:Transposase n=1 Tax=Roseibium denhamense TaxID=76305 RepID=A0ABY1P4H1_9HYPH|nr:hypothetical protein [Roseibium denhamense]MTI07699.1 hypothetical protein [Roseibium denhamense]SMP24726.1 hypothetical protein SAMN06265374_2467 [Roseibium denhamense]
MQKRSGSADLEICPVPDMFLKRLVDAGAAAVREIGDQLPERQRAALAVYCFRRAHWRTIGLSIAADCSRSLLVDEAGYAGEQIYQLSRQGATNEQDMKQRPRGTRPPVSLHVV